MSNTDCHPTITALKSRILCDLLAHPDPTRDNVRDVYMWEAFFASEAIRLGTADVQDAIVRDAFGTLWGCDDVVPYLFPFAPVVEVAS